MSTVTKVIHSADTNSAQVFLDSGEVACVLLTGPDGLSELLKDVDNGQLAAYIDDVGGDAASDVAADYAEASDWDTVYGA